MGPSPIAVTILREEAIDGLDHGRQTLDIRRQRRNPRSPPARPSEPQTTAPQVGDTPPQRRAGCVVQGLPRQSTEALVW
jgi:hypothetical protein